MLLNSSTNDTSSRIRPRGFSRAIGTVACAKDRMRAILADKTTLVRVRLLPRERMAKKDERPCCVFCARKFRTFSRKVHCRGCGEVVCSACYRKKEVQVGPTPTDTLPVRLCLDCIDRALSSPSLKDQDEMDDGVEGSFTNSGRVTLSACSTHMAFVDGVLVETSPQKSPTIRTVKKNKDSFVNLSPYDQDSEGGDTDRESANSYESDGEDQSSFHLTSAHKPRRTSSMTSTTSTASTSGSLSGSGSGSSSSRTTAPLGFVPENESLVADFTRGMKLTLGDLEVDTESQRSERFAQLGVASLDRQREFDALCELVSRALHCRVAAVGFISESAQWYKSKIGISQTKLPRDVAFCSQLLDKQEATVVLDASQDVRFFQNPLVTGSAHIRFYASTPICDPDSQLVLGSVFVMDPDPKRHMPTRTLEVLAYASQAAQKLLRPTPQGTRKRTSSRQKKRVHRVLSEPALVDSNVNDDDDDVEGGTQFSKSDGARSGALWTSTPPLSTKTPVEPSRARSPSFRSSYCATRITLLDMESFTSLKRVSRRSIAATESDDEREGRATLPRMAAAAALPSMDCEDIQHQIEATQQLLSGIGPSPTKKATVATEVEV